MKSELVAAWLLTLALHAAVLLTLAWFVDGRLPRGQLGWREWLWRIALFGALLTASGQMLLDTPKAARIAPTRIVEASLPTAHPSRAIPRSEPELSSTTSMSTHSRPRSLTSHVSADSEESTLVATTAPMTLPTWYQYIVAAWLAGALLALARIARAWKQMQRTLASAEDYFDEAIGQEVAQLAGQAGVAVPYLLVMHELASPAALHGHRIVLPHWVFERLDRAQLRAMLAHEIAHLARRDPARKLAIAAVSALLWFVPLTGLARRRLDTIAEQACDAWAVKQCGDGRGLAECLYECAEHHLRGPELDFAAAMSGRHSPILQRINQLIDGAPMNLRVSLPRLLVATALTLSAALVLLPGIGVLQASAATERPLPPVAPVPPAAPAVPKAAPAALPSPPPAPVAAPAAAAAPAEMAKPAVAPIPPMPPIAPTPPAPPAPPSEEAGTGHHLSISSDSDDSNNRISMKMSDGGHSYNAEIRGAVEFTSNYDGIDSLARGATASFGEKRDGISRRVDYSNPNGKLQRQYFVDDHEQAFDATAGQWIATVIPNLVRETALDADKRVQRILASGGVPGVLAEIGKVQSDYARSVYIGALSKHPKLSAAEVTGVLALIDPMHSDYERRNALAALGSGAPFNATQQTLVIGQAKKIGSDYERAELLLGLLADLASDKAVHEAWLQAANGIQSDYEHRRTLSALIEAGSNDDAILSSVIDAAQTIDSGYERRELLSSAIGAINNADPVAAAYAKSVDGIAGDYERREALVSLIQAKGFGKQSAFAVLDSVGKISSDNECREVLTALAAVMPADADLVARYRVAARKLSDFERGEAERALDRFSS